MGNMKNILQKEVTREGGEDKMKETHPHLLSTPATIARLLIEGVVQGVSANSPVFIPRQSCTGTSSEITP